MTAVELDVYDITGGDLVKSLVASGALVKGITVREDLNQAGSGRLMLHVDSPDAWPVTSLDNLVVLKLDGTAVFEWRIARRRYAAVTQGEQAERWISVEGPGRLADWGWAVQYPTPPGSRYEGVPERGALDWPPPDDRAWNFASWNYDLAAVEAGEEWVACTALAQVTDTGSPWTGHPGAFPDDDAWYIYPGAGDDPQPPGRAYIRERFWLDGPTRVRLAAAADNYATVWLDEEIVLEADGFLESHEADLVLDEGEHLVAVELVNDPEPQGDTPTAVAWSVIELLTNATTGEPELGYVICRSWGTGGGSPAPTQRQDPPNGIAQPPTTPGFTPGQMVVALDAEAREREVETFRWSSTDVTATLDSDGQAYAERLDLLLRHGMNYLQILEVIAEAACDVHMAVGGTLQLHDRRGTDRATGGVDDVTLEVGVTLRELGFDETPPDVTALLVRDDDGWREHRRDAAIAQHGRREDFLSVGDATSVDQSGRVAETVFDLHADGLETVQVETIDAAPVGWLDYGVGDVVWLTGRLGGLVRVRVMSIELVVDDTTGHLTFKPGVALA